MKNSEEENLNETGTCDEVDSKLTEIIEIEENSSANEVKKRRITEGLMDITLITANANQLRLVLTYYTKSPICYITSSLIILSLILQVCVGIAIILKRTSSKKSRIKRTKQFHVVSVFIITFINILIAVFTTTESYY